MPKLIVTSGECYTDIDAFACAIAYAEALQLAERDAEAVLPGPLNVSITAELRDAAGRYAREAPVGLPCILVDVSAPKVLPAFVALNDVQEVYDHHQGYAAFWHRRIGGRARIEGVGAAATLVWERIMELGVDGRVSAAAARLLASAIVSNTVGMTATVAGPRDVHALKAAQARAALPAGWEDAYFAAVDAAVRADTAGALANDTKTIEGAWGEPIKVGQLEVREAGSVPAISELAISERAFGLDLLIVTVQTERRTWVLSGDDRIQTMLRDAFGARFNHGKGVINAVVLRKAILPHLCRPAPPRAERKAEFVSNSEN